MTIAQMNLDLAGKRSARVILEHIREEGRDAAEKCRWFDQSFMRFALQEPKIEIHEIWRRPHWSGREALNGGSRRAS